MGDIAFQTFVNSDGSLGGVTKFVEQKAAPTMHNVPPTPPEC